MDAEQRIWGEIESLNRRYDSDRNALGLKFLELRNLYSERCADSRTSSGHGTFLKEIKARGYSVRTVQGWIADAVARQNGTQTQAQKRAERRAAQAPTKPTSKPNSGESPWEAFGRMLPYEAAKGAYLAAAKTLHADHGGTTEGMQKLNDAWARLEALYEKGGNAGDWHAWVN